MERFFPLKNKTYKTPWCLIFNFVSLSQIFTVLYVCHKKQNQSSAVKGTSEFLLSCVDSSFAKHMVLAADLMSFLLLFVFFLLRMQDSGKVLLWKKWNITFTCQQKKVRNCNNFSLFSLSRKHITFITSKFMGKTEWHFSLSAFFPLYFVSMMLNML